MAKLRAGVIGAGVMGKHHARVLSNLAGVELVGIVDPKEQKLSLSHDVPYLENLQELLKIGIDYCVIATPTITHEEIATFLIGNDIHLLIEKPLAHSYQAANNIKNACSKKRIIAAVGHIERFNSSLIEAKKRIENGELGDIFQISTIRQGPIPPRIMDVGVTNDLGTHDIDITRWIAQKNYSQVSAYGHISEGKQFEDLVAVNGILENDIVVNHLVNWLNPKKERKIFVTAQKGVFAIDTLSSELVYYENGKMQISDDRLTHFSGVVQGNIFNYAFQKREPLVREHESFRDSILGKENNNVSIEEGMYVIKVVEAVLQSILLKKSVKI